MCPRQIYSHGYTEDGSILMAACVGPGQEAGPTLCTRELYVLNSLRQPCEVEDYQSILTE